MIFIVGLGPGSPENLTLGAWDELSAPDRVVRLRTEKHDVAEYLRSKAVEFATYDHYYQAGEDFSAVYDNIAEDLIRLAQLGRDVVYAVPGNPWVAEQTVPRTLELARQSGVAVKVLHGMSSLEAVYGELSLDPTAGLVVADALDGEKMPIDPRSPMLITQVYSRLIAGDLKLSLLGHYPADHPIHIVTHAGGTAVAKVKLPLCELDHREYGHAEMVFVPAYRGAAKAGQQLEVLAKIMARLRDDGGCPWDQEQTHLSLRPYLIEETYEVLDALDAEDPAKLAEELGDLMLQIVFHAQIAAETGDFNLADPIRLICEKLIRRHPHVFGDVTVAGSGEVLQNWRAIKQGERAKTGSAPSCILDTVPQGFPALLEAAKVQARAKEVGFDWPDMTGPLTKVREELAELLDAVSTEDTEGTLEELGDLLFAVVNVARFAGVEPENALRLATRKFRLRFAQVSQLAAERGLVMGRATLAELDALWDETKQKRTVPEAGKEGLLPK